MLTFGPLSFAAPLALLGLVTLPVIWWVLRATPPQPNRVVFPPLKLLLGLQPQEETPDHTPWWVIVLRLMLAALIILGLSQPIIAARSDEPAEGPLILLVDDGWSAAPNWSSTVQAARLELETAARDNRTAAVIYTAPYPGAGDDVVLQDPREALAALQAHTPRPWDPDPAAVSARLEAAAEAGDLDSEAEYLWLTDRVARDGVDVLANTLAGLGGRVRVQGPGPSQLPLMLRPPQADARGLGLQIVRASDDGSVEGTVIALDAQGRSLVRTPFAFADGETVAETVAETPLEVRNRIAGLRLETSASAGGAQVLDDAWRQPLVGLITAGGDTDRQPLLSELHYVEQALAERAQTVRGTVDELIAREPGAIVLTDTAQPTPAGLNALKAYVNNGGLLIRFAGPRVADDPDDLIPVQLRTGGRLLGGALAWDEPQPLGAFTSDGPFYDIAAPAEATVGRQVLAEPAPDLNEKVWARLADGTPLVTSDRRGRGRLIFFHITASPDWSQLPLSGIFPELLTRSLSFAGSGGSGARPDAPASGPWTLQTAVDWEGRFVAAEGSATIAADVFASAPFSPTAPPGVYDRGPQREARNIAGAETTISAITALPGGLAIEALGGNAPLSLAGPLLAAALIVLIVDALAMAGLSGRLRLPQGRRRGGAPAALAGLIAMVGVTGLAAVGAGGAAMAQTAAGPVDTTAEDSAIAALEELRLAYVVTGERSIDTLSRAGLAGLSDVLTTRTSVEPGDPLGIDLERDDLGLSPLLYWPITTQTPAPSAAVVDKLDLFMKTGGVLILDTQDGDTALSSAPHQGLTRLADALDIPPLQRLPRDHVLTRSFYLLSDLPGRWSNTPIWVEADQRGSARDGVTSVVITSSDWAAAWAVDADGQPLAVLAGGGERQRELAFRAGINLVMYVLTGNYKADQVHVDEILERLGQ